MRNTKNLIPLIVALTFTGYSSFINAGGYTQLPRNFGPFEIGMTGNDFIKLTGVIPYSCAICIKNEKFASLQGSQLMRFDVADKGGDFFFYNDILYHIAIEPKEKDLFTAQQDYESRFDGPGTPVKNNGIEILKWEDPGTVITLNYREKEVNSINIYDWNIKEERDWRESTAKEQSPATATLE